MVAPATPLMLPTSCPKAPGSFDRCVPLEQTLALIPELRRRYGITRLADTTYLDRTGMPTFSAIVPESLDLLSVYNGKGFTREAAIASAVMEAVERQVGASPPSLTTFPLNLRTVQERLDIHALELKEEMYDAVVDCVHGTDLLSGELVPVPMAMVQCPWYGKGLFKVTSTNGLASGNNLTEALYHALCELVERHTWSMYHAKSHLLPRMYQGVDASDIAYAKQIKFPTGNALVDELCARVHDVGLSLRVLYLEEESLPATMLACVTDVGAQPPMAHMGYGTSLSPSHAMTRAVTEAIQGRVVDIQAAREDILRMSDAEGVLGSHGRRQAELPAGRWYFDLEAEVIELGTLPDPMTSDLASDLLLVMQQLREMGASCIAAVDLSPPDVPVHVVRLVIPELETAIVNGRIGRKILSFLNPFKIHSAPRSADL
ncbi:MAG: YcaO-related McrA-glycine thioamidation protein [Vulcanimicrobiaceae bacterium]